MKKKVLIHNVIILDASGSMQGEKYRNAIEALNEEMEVLKKDKNAEYTQTIVEFNSAINSFTKEHYFMQPLKECYKLEGIGANGGTPLYEVVGNTLEKVAMSIQKGENVLIKIFTDGEENTSTGRFRDPKELQKLINILEKANFMITFEGTEFDAERAFKELGINRRNMNLFDGSAVDLKRSAKSRLDSTLTYSANLADGIVSHSFYNG